MYNSSIFTGSKKEKAFGEGSYNLQLLKAYLPEFLYAFRPTDSVKHLQKILPPQAFIMLVVQNFSPPYCFPFLLYLGKYPFSSCFYRAAFQITSVVHS